MSYQEGEQKPGELPPKTDAPAEPGKSQEPPKVTSDQAKSVERSRKLSERPSTKQDEPKTQTADSKSKLQADSKSDQPSKSKMVTMLGGSEELWSCCVGFKDCYSFRVFRVVELRLCPGTVLLSLFYSEPPCFTLLLYFLALL